MPRTPIALPEPPPSPSAPDKAPQVEQVLVEFLFLGKDEFRAAIRLLYERLRLNPPCAESHTDFPNLFAIAR